MTRIPPIVFLIYALLICQLRGATTNISEPKASPARGSGSGPPGVLLSPATLSSLSRQHLELKLRDLERASFAKAIANMRRENFSMAGFFHASNYQKLWREVATEMLMLMDGRRINVSAIEAYEKGADDWIPYDNNHYASVLSEVDSLFINFAASASLKNKSLGVQQFNEFRSYLVNNIPIRNASLAKLSIGMNYTVPRRAESNKIHLMRSLPPPDSELQSLERRFGANQLSVGETSTIASMQHFCQQAVRSKQNVLVFYVHLKGTCCGRSTVPRQPPFWREVMSTFMLEFPSLCLHNLLAVNNENANSMCSHIREQQTLQLNCAAGKVITSIDFASYGNPKGGCYDPSKFQPGSCHSTSTHSLIKSRCLGKPTCKLFVSNNVFGDPCINLKKSLAVQVTCNNPNATQSETSPSNSASYQRRYKTCGLNFRIDAGHNPPHYPGNFWWSTCEHVASLQPITGQTLFDAWAAEWFPLSVSADYRQRQAFARTHVFSMHTGSHTSIADIPRIEYLHSVEDELLKWT